MDAGLGGMVTLLGTSTNVGVNMREDGCECDCIWLLCAFIMHKLHAMCHLAIARTMWYAIASVVPHQSSRMSHTHTGAVNKSVHSKPG